VKLATHLRLVPRSRDGWSCTSTPPMRLHDVVLNWGSTGTTLSFVLLRQLFCRFIGFKRCLLTVLGIGPVDSWSSLEGRWLQNKCLYITSMKWSEVKRLNNTTGGYFQTRLCVKNTRRKFETTLGHLTTLSQRRGYIQLEIWSWMMSG
jgi:hypothetical protein